MRSMTVHADRHQQRDQDNSPTNTESPGEETRGEADQDEFPALYRRSLDHRGRLGVGDPGLAALTFN